MTEKSSGGLRWKQEDLLRYDCIGSDFSVSTTPWNSSLVLPPIPVSTTDEAIHNSSFRLNSMLGSEIDVILIPRLEKFKGPYTQ